MILGKSSQVGVPPETAIITCQYCGQNIPAVVPNTSQIIVNSCRKFSHCLTCRDMIVGQAGILDRGTHGLERDRKLKG